MSVGDLIYLTAKHYEKHGKDVYVWTVSAEESMLQPLRTIIRKSRLTGSLRVLAAFQHESEIYVLKDRFFNVPRCFRFKLTGDSTTTSKAATVYPGYQAYLQSEPTPTRRVPYDVRTHELDLEYVEEVSLKRVWNRALTLRDGSELEGRMLPSPDEIRYAAKKTS